MKKFVIWGVSVVVFILMFILIGYTKVPIGYEGVKINTLGTGKGGIKVVGVGRHFYPGKYEMYLFPLFKQNYVWTVNPIEGSENDESITFQSKESLTFSADVGISYSVMSGRSDDLYATYHKGVDEITDIDMRNSVRNAFNILGSLRSVEEIFGEGKSLFLKAIFEEVSNQWTPQGIEVHNIYLIGEMRPPAEVKTAISAKIRATQIAQQRRNEVKEAIAAADKKIETARGDAESRILKATAEAKSISLVEKQLSKSPMYINYIKANKWDGKLPQFVGSNVMPMMNIGK